MGEWFEALSSMEKFFATCGAGGGTLFLIRMLLMLLGAGQGDGVGGVDDDFSTDGHDGTVADSDASFHLLSLNTVSAFVMMFGLVGFAVLRANLVAAVGALVCAVIGGGLAMYVTALLFGLMLRLQTSGTLDVDRAIGAEGTVYLTVPAEGTGKVQVVVQDRLMEFDAVSEQKVELKTGERIRVVWVIRGNVLSVERAE